MLIADAGSGGDQVQLVLALEAFLNDLHMEEAEEAAAETEAKGDGAFRLEEEGGVVEAEFFESVAEQRVLVRVHGVEAGEDHGLDVFKSGQGVRSGVRFVGDGVADFGVADVLDGGGEESDLAGDELADFNGLGDKHAHGIDLEGFSDGHEPDALAFAHGSLHDADQYDDAAVGVEPRVEDEGLQRRIGIALGRRKPVHDCFKHLFNALAGFGADGDGIGGVQPDGLLDVFLGAQNVGRGQVDLVDHGNHLEAVMEGQIGVGEGLRFDALGGVDNEERALARGQRARDFIAEVDVAGRVDQIELVGVAVAGLVHHAHGMGFDGDAALPLEVHVVEDLGLHLATGNRARQLEQAVAERGLAVIDVRNNREVAEKTGVHWRAFGGVGFRNTMRNLRRARSVSSSMA